MFIHLRKKQKARLSRGRVECNATARAMGSGWERESTKKKGLVRQASEKTLKVANDEALENPYMDLKRS